MPHIWFSACLLLERRGEARRQRKGEDFQLLLPHFVLADIYNRLGRYEESRQHVDKARELQKTLSY